MKKLDLLVGERRAFQYHLSYSFIEGIIAGVLALNEFVLLKSLHGSNYQIGILFQLSVVLLLFSIIITEFLKRYLKKKKLLRLVAVITRFPLFLFMFFPEKLGDPSKLAVFHIVFLLIFLFYYMANPIIFPTINYILKNAYRHNNFGKLYSYATSLNKIVMLVATFVFGLLLDLNPFSFKYVYPVLGLLGIVSIYLLSLIDPGPGEEINIKSSFWQSLVISFNKMVHIIKNNRPFRDFEIGFMLYGFAWMVTIAVITIFLDKQLGLNYSSLAFYKNSYNIIAIILLPFFGRLIGKIDPRRFAIYTFGSLMLFLVFLALTEYLPYYTEFLGIKLYYSLIVSYLFHAIFAATMALLWFIGSAYFCPEKEAGDYQSIHLSLTGFRGLFAPLMGVFFYELIGFTGTFAIGIFSLLVAVLLMRYSMKRK